jgi:hypothetical protein
MTKVGTTVMTKALAGDSLHPTHPDMGLEDNTDDFAFLLFKSSAQDDYTHMPLKTSPVLDDDIRQLGLAGALWPTPLPDKPGIYVFAGVTRYQYHLSDNNAETVYHAVHEGTFQLVSPKVQLLGKTAS